MKRLLATIFAILAGLFANAPLRAQLHEPVKPINLIIDSDMSLDADDVGDHALMWALANRGEVKVIALIASSANDYSAPAMNAIATYYGYGNVLVGAHKGSGPTAEGSASSPYALQVTNQFGTPGDTRFNYPDAVTVYRQALANAPDGSVYIVANGYFQPLQGLLQSQPDSISPLSGVDLVRQKVRRFICSGGVFPSGQEHNFRVDADAASYVFANWPGEIVSVGSEVGADVITGPDPNSDPTKDPVRAAYYYQGVTTTPAWGQVAVLYAARGLSTNFTVGGYNGQTVVWGSNASQPGFDFWSSTPQVGHSYVEKQISAADMAAIINPLVQGSSNMPIVASISPATVPAGAAAPTVTFSGHNFFADSQVFVNGSSRPTTYVSGTQITAQLDSSDIAQVGNQQLTVQNAAEGNWTSTPAVLNVYASIATLTGISPSSAIAGSAPLNVTVTGSGFAASSFVQVNGSARSTTFNAPTQLTAIFTAADLATAGSLQITVVNPGGGTSSAVTFTVNNPVPGLTSMSPTAVTAGTGNFTLAVNGSNFVAGSVVQVNGSARSTTFVSSTQLKASVVASDIAAGGYLSITVANSAPGGGTSSALTLTVNNPVPSISSVSPNPVIATGSSFTLTVSGAGFNRQSVVQIDGVAQQTTFVNPTTVTASIPNTNIIAIGQHAVTVVNPAPGGGKSNTATVTVVAALGSLEPATINGDAPLVAALAPKPEAGFALTV